LRGATYAVHPRKLELTETPNKISPEIKPAKYSKQYGFIYTK
jgi:hypothetical protein